MEDQKEWKKSIGFPINYSSENSDDDFDLQDVVMRHPRQSEQLLADEGDGAAADLLGSTPPRERIRNKSKRKAVLDALGLRVNTRDANEQTAHERDRPRNRLSLKIQRARERDFKQGSSGGAAGGPRADSLPSPAARTPRAAVPTLVESCNRFMSLASRLKCSDARGGNDNSRAADDTAPLPERRGGGGGGGGEELPPSRVNFHKTFSMLINMGNIDKGCRRTISREEQVWQNELKDLIWLELQAKIAARTLAEQDAFLCAQRTLVPNIIHNILTYKFVNKNPCRSRSQRPAGAASPEEGGSASPGEGGAASPGEGGAEPDSGDDDYDDVDACCLSLSCCRCAAAVGAALRAVGALLDAYHRALQLYPSSHALTADHPPVATHTFKSRLKAMCLWYNTALHMRLKVLAVRRMIRTMKAKAQRQHHKYSPALSTDSEPSRTQPDTPRPCTVRFNVGDTPSSSNNSSNTNNSDSSSVRHKDSGKETDDEPAKEEQRGEEDETDGGREENKVPAGSQNDEEIKNEDVVDRAEPPTPEIVISDARYDTADTADTSESGYTSAADGGGGGGAGGAGHDDVFELGDLADVTELRLLNRAPVSIYRSYHHEMLKTQGVRRCMTFISKMRCNLLHKVYLTFEKPHGSSATQRREAGGEVFDDARDDDGDDTHDDDDAYELRRYGCYSEESLSMRLPSYRGHFLLLSAVCMEAAHDYLSLRLEDRPASPSCLTVKQLIHELKEGLDIATEMRAAFARNIEVALEGQRGGRGVRADLLLIIRIFDDTVETVLKQYLSYLRTMSAVEQMSRASLQAEWSFTARLARRVRCAVLLAPMTFSEIACNQLDRVAKQFKHKFEQLEEFAKSAGDPDDKHFVYTMCRAVQAVYAGEREAALHAAQWARSLAARLARRPQHADQRQAIFTSLLNIRNLIVAQTTQVLQRSRAEFSEEADALPARARELMLQIYRLGFELHKELYRFAQAPFQLEQERNARRRPVSLQPIRPHDDRERPRRPETMVINESINPLIHKELHRFVHDSAVARSGARRGSGVTSRAGGVGGAGAAGGGRPRYLRAESIGEDAEPSVFDDRLFENINNYQTHSSIELFLMGESAERSYASLAHPALVPQASRTDALVSQASRADALVSRAAQDEHTWATLVARAVVEFAHCWMQFVIERCEKGRGLRPRWAHQGLEFLMLACDPCNTRHLSEQEFEELKRKMDGCISHVIGSRPPTPRAADPCPHAPHAPHGPSPQEHKTRRRPNRIHSPLPGGSAAPLTPPQEHELNFNFPEVDFAVHSARVLEATARLDAARARKLAAARAVGRVLAAPVATYEPKLRQLNFKWQRGLKIGAGTFGKVYTVVNTETGQLLAMKEISIGAGDRRALQRAANELRVLEGVIHPHLVRHYGCELHREEMLIFMELCVEGSLEALLATSGALQEPAVRRYTKQLLSAVAELHARGIAHRDIKSGNIFLTNEGHCLKLGDFGCAVKIRANTTAAGELVGHVGTQAYMAPEVFMKATGHGRAADVWSLGCVVVEMASGQRPFSEYDSNVQIMFVVGMGGRPAVPAALSAEGRAFCRAALAHEPEQRPRADHLLMHHFLKLNTDDDCKCEPAYLIT